MEEVDIRKEIDTLEKKMADPNFWENKDKAQDTIVRLNNLKEELLGVHKYDKGNAVVTIFSGAGGDDAEDFSRMLFDMYSKFAVNKNLETLTIHKNENDYGGYRNITFEVIGKNAYGLLNNESGVHRLVRISPFNANKKRHTSFSMVEVIPELKDAKEVSIPDNDLRFEFSKSSGPGGQNVNKRETAVRVIHIPTNFSVHVDSERSQLQNKEKALEILRGKLYKKAKEDIEKKKMGMKISKTTSVEWGNQIRSYILHPYKMVKDHRSGVEVRDADKVLDGELDEFVYNKNN